MSFPAYFDCQEIETANLGDIPSHWELKRLKDVASHNDEALADDTPEDAEFLYVDISSVNTLQGIHTKEEVVFKNAPSRARRKVQNGDVIVSTVRTYLKAIARVIEPEENLIVSTGFAVVRPSQQIDPAYAGFLLLSNYFIDEVISRSTGVSYPAINASDLVRIHVPVPPLSEQKAISSFLDVETSKIDGLVSEQRRLIELLKEKRQAVISHAVTKGLNPNAPMKPSGIQWLGDVPQHWEVMKLGRVTLDRCDGPFGSGLKSSHYTDEGIRVIRLNNIRHDYFDNTDAAFIDPDHYQNALRGGHDVVAGDLLIAGLGDANNAVGRACVAPDGIEPAMVKADCFRYRLDTAKTLTAFLSAQLTIGAPTDAGLMSTGTTRSRMPLSVTSSRMIAFPPVEEQQEIVDHVGERGETFSQLQAEAERAIELLQERRTALISAAVTGKIDVRGFTPS